MRRRLILDAMVLCNSCLLYTSEAKAEYAEAKAQVKKTVDKVLDSVEKFAE